MNHPMKRFCILIICIQILAILPLQAAESLSETEPETEVITLYVENGGGSGSYSAGDSVHLRADWPETGKVFSQWTVVSGNISIDRPTRCFAAASLSEGDAVVRAEYKDGPAAKENTVTGIEDDGMYLMGTKLTFTAVGSGMNSTNPNPGDYRWKPVRYTIGSTSGSLNNDYTVSMAINAPGSYKLTVAYQKEYYDGSSWRPSEETAEKTTAFYIADGTTFQFRQKYSKGLLIAAGLFMLMIILFIFRRNAARGRK